MDDVSPFPPILHCDLVLVTSFGVVMTGWWCQNIRFPPSMGHTAAKHQGAIEMLLLPV